MTARTALKDLHRLTDPLYAAQSILPPKPSFTGPERGLINGWKAYLTWEQENKLVIEDKDALAARIGYAMRQCVGQMRHFPELWYVHVIYIAPNADILGTTFRTTMWIRIRLMKPLLYFELVSQLAQTGELARKVASLSADLQCPTHIRMCRSSRRTKGVDDMSRDLRSSDHQPHCRSRGAAKDSSCRSRGCSRTRDTECSSDYRRRDPNVGSNGSIGPRTGE